MTKQTEASIIQIIQEMVKKGEPEEKILSTLKELGVTEEQAKRLLLLGEADTFSLLKNEINKMVNLSIKKETPELTDLIKTEIRVEIKKAENELINENREKLNELTKNTQKKQDMFEAKINQRILKLTDLTDRIKGDSVALSDRIQKLELDLDELKVSGVGKRNKNVSIILIVLGIIFSGSALYFFFTTFKGIISIDTLIITIIMAIISITMFFVSTIV